MKKRLGYLLLSLTIASNLMADITLNTYKSLSTQEKASLKDYIGGVGKGISWSSSYVKYIHQISIYCAPPKLYENSDSFVEILNREIATNKHKDNEAIEFILLQGIQNTYPCTK